MQLRSSLALPAALSVAMLLGACQERSPAAVVGGAADSNVEQAAVTITGGHDTDAVDNGRPIVLVAAMLGVEPQVFRTAFSGVTPATGGEAPQDVQVQRNKAALLAVLAPYGVTNEQLDAASNDYRYLASAGETWARRDARATATVVDGVVTEVKVLDAGRGYSSSPTISVALPDGTTISATATLEYTTEFETNGSITAIAVP